MLSFEVTAIDLVLVIAVVALLLLYVIKLANSPEELIKKSLEQSVKHQKAPAESKNDLILKVNDGFSECPRGFGKIKGIGNDNQISDRCLGCYKMSLCYAEEDKIEA